MNSRTVNILDTTRDKIGADDNENLENVITLINDKFDSPLDIRLEENLLYVESSVKRKLMSNKKGGTKDSYARRLPILKGIDIYLGESQLNLQDGTTTGYFKNATDPGVVVSANKYIQMGIELREDGYLYIVWGAEYTDPNNDEIPAFTDAGLFQVMLIALQNNGVSGAWNFNTPDIEDIEIILSQNTAKKNDVGVIPLGGVIATFPNLTGAYNCTATTVADSNGFVKMNGQVISDTNSPMNGVTIPNVNNDVFLMGSTTAGSSGGSNNLRDHTHGFSLTAAEQTYSGSGTTSNEDTNHTHGFSGKTSGQSANHYHGLSIQTWNATESNYAGMGTGNTANEGNKNGIFTGDTGIASADHTHTYSGDTGGISANHKHSFSWSGTSSGSAVSGTVGSGSGATSTENRPKYISAVYLMRIK